MKIPKKEFEKRITLALAVFFVMGAIFGTIVSHAVEDSIFPPKVAVTETYTVKPGDTFWKIAERYREKDCRNPYIFTFMDELREQNPFLVETSNQLNVGDVISITYWELEDKNGL